MQDYTTLTQELLHGRLLSRVHDVLVVTDEVSIHMLTKYFLCIQNNRSS